MAEGDRVPTIASYKPGLFPLTIEVGPISIDGSDVTVLQAEFYEIHEIFNRIIDSLSVVQVSASPSKFI